MNIPADLRYAQSHEWSRLNGDGSVTVGISDHAQEQLGDLVFVEMPDTDGELIAGEACAVVESVKAASDIYAPLDGKVLEINERLGDQPELVNEDPYGEGWLFRLMPADATGLDDLLDADAYASAVAAGDG